MNAQQGDSLTELFYQQLYSYHFVQAESSLKKIQSQQENDILSEMIVINYGYWMLFTGKNNSRQNAELIERIELNIHKLENDLPKNALSQENLLQLIMLYSFKSRIQYKLDNTISAIQSFRSSYLYFKRLKPCSGGECEIYNLVTGMYYVLSGHIRKDYPLLFILAFDKEFADINKGLFMLSKGIKSPILQIQTESRYFLMKLHAEVNEDPEKALIYANQLIRLFPGNLTYRIYQLGLYSELGKKQKTELAYSRFLREMKNNKQLTKNQRRVLLEECHETIKLTGN